MTRSAADKYRPLLLATLALIALPFLLRALGLSLNTGTMVVALAIAAMGLNLCIGYTGLVSFGHSDWFGVGAYAAGLILEETHYTEFAGKGEHRLEELVRPISVFLVPVFFVLMGMRVEIGALLQPGVLGLAAVLTVVAVAGKQACALGGIGAPVDRTTIGLGMIPRGEVGLIFANIGLGLTVGGERLVDERIFAAVVVAVMLTTLVTPPALKWRLTRTARRRAEEDAAQAHAV